MQLNPAVGTSLVLSTPADDRVRFRAALGDLPKAPGASPAERARRLGVHYNLGNAARWNLYLAALVLAGEVGNTVQAVTARASLAVAPAEWRALHADQIALAL